MAINYAKRAQLADGFAKVINEASVESDSNTPDYILGEYLVRCLEAYGIAVTDRDRHKAPAVPSDHKTYPVNPGPYLTPGTFPPRVDCGCAPGSVCMNVACPRRGFAFSATDSA